MDDHCRTWEDQLEQAIVGGPVAEEFNRHLKECRTCRQEIEQCRRLSNELNALGGYWLEQLPQVDVLPDVTQSIAKLRPSAFRRLLMPSLVAACLIIMMVWPMLTAQHNDGTIAPAAPENTQMAGVLGNFERLANEWFVPHAYGSPEHPSTIKTNDIVQELGKGLATVPVRRRLHQWGSLAPVDCMSLVNRADSSLAAQIGASQWLPQEEAYAVLSRAVNEPNYQDDPVVYLMWIETCRGLGRENDRIYSEYWGAIERLRELDPQNALALYVEARALLDDGRTSEALDVLQDAATLPKACAYTQRNLKYIEEALKQAGTQTDSARLLVALTAGEWGHRMLVQLGHDLLAHSELYRHAGQPDIADAICDAVHVFGAQVVAGEAFAAERLAGYDIQACAAAYNPSDGALVALDKAASQLHEELGRLAQTIEKCRNGSDDELCQLADTIITHGDLALLSESHP